MEQSMLANASASSSQPEVTIDQPDWWSAAYGWEQRPLGTCKDEQGPTTRNCEEKLERVPLHTANLNLSHGAANAFSSRKKLKEESYLVGVVARGQPTRIRFAGRPEIACTSCHLEICTNLLSTEYGWCFNSTLQISHKMSPVTYTNLEPYKERVSGKHGRVLLSRHIPKPPHIANKTWHDQAPAYPSTCLSKFLPFTILRSLPQKNCLDQDL